MLKQVLTHYFDSKSNRRSCPAKPLSTRAYTSTLQKQASTCKHVQKQHAFSKPGWTQKLKQVACDIA